MTVTLKRGGFEALSQAALETLSIVAYEQPVTRTDIRDIRSVDSDAVVETFMARGLVAEGPRFGCRGRPSFLVTTLIFLRNMGLGSLEELPPRPAQRPETGHRQLGYELRKGRPSPLACAAGTRA